MNTIDSLTLQVPDPEAARAFYAGAFGIELGLRPSDSPAPGFPGFTLSLVVSQPATVDALVEAAIAAGATTLKPTKKSLWGYGGVLRAPDGTIWKIATAKKKNSGPATRAVDDVVLLLGVTDVVASKRYYEAQGLTATRSFGRKYAEFAIPSSTVKLALYQRGALAKDAGVAPDGDGSHPIVIRGARASFTDPDGFAWEAA